MSVSFNFLEQGSKFGTGTDPGPVTFIETEDNGGGQVVRFTISTNADGGSESVTFGSSTFGGFQLQLNDRGASGTTGAPTFGNDIFTLRFEETGNTANNQLTGSGANAVAFQAVAVVGSISYQWLTANGTKAGGVLGSSNQVAPTSLNGVGITGIRFTTLGNGTSDFFNVISLTANALNCFCAGTRIATTNGEVSVETLAAGDEVLTAEGAVSTVTWVGRQEVDVRLGNPKKINPVCISRGALGESIPERDLWVSGDHAIGIDGYLINANAMVNGTSIYQVAQMPLDGFTYYHIETDAHEFVLAEGCPAETFVDYAKLDAFENADERKAHAVQEMAVPRISAARMIPDAIRARIAERAAVAKSAAA